MLYWHSDKTAAISTEYCSTTSGQHHSSPTQPSLASGAAKDLFQDCDPRRMEANPRRRNFISARILRRAGAGSSTTSLTAVGIDWMCRHAKCADVGGPQRSFAFHGPRPI